MAIKELLADIKRIKHAKLWSFLLRFSREEG